MALVLVAAMGCKPQGTAANPKAPPLRVLCGSSMATPIQELIPQFEALHGPVLLDLGGSETLLPRVLANAPADLFICHDPFEEKVREAGKLSRSVEMGQLRPVLLTQLSNPKKVQRLEDLAQKGVRLGIGDPRYSTCGELFVGVLKQRGIRDQVMSNAVLQARTHTELANGLSVGSLDAIVVWNFIARMYEGKVCRIETRDAYPPVRVTVLGLSSSTNQALRNAFLDFCATPTARAVFDKHGYGPPSRSW